MRVRVLLCTLAVSCASITEGGRVDPPEPPSPTRGQLAMPALISLPYVSVDQSSTLRVTVENLGDEPLTGLSWSLEGDPLLSIQGAPTRIEGRSTATVEFLFTGAAQETIAEALLQVNTLDEAKTAQVFAVAGDENLGASVWETVSGPNQELMGEGATLSMPTAPYPDAGASFTDDSVRLFVPEGYRERGSQDVILHFHGHSTTLASTLAAHRYQQHVYASGVNAILVVPQGPVNAASGDFGKLMSPSNTEKFLQQVLVVLYREGKIAAPRLGDVVLTSHSGGYQAVAANLNNGGRFFVSQVNLFDSLYGFSSTYQSFAEDGGLLRSNYTTGGGTLANNLALAENLLAEGVAVSEEVTTLALRDAPAEIYFANSSHNGSTRVEGAYGEQLRWGMTHSRRGPRLEIRHASLSNGLAEIAWLAPHDEDLEKFLVETSLDGLIWSTAAETTAQSVSFALSGEAFVRVTPVLTGVEASQIRSSSEVYLSSQRNLLVVDGFDRRVDGSFAGLTNNFAATIAREVGASAFASHRALTEDGLSLQSVDAILWLAGDESTADVSLSDDEQALLSAYVQAGGKLLLSGSELAFSLNQSSFLSSVVGASLQADDSNSAQVSGVGALSALGSFSFGGVDAAYQEDFPDALLPQSGAEVLLQYAGGLNAAIGREHQVVLVGFPVELLDDGAPLLQALLGYLNIN